MILVIELITNNMHSYRCNPPFSGVILPFIWYIMIKCVTPRILIRGWRHTVELSVRFVEISYIIHFDTISEIGYLLMLERENFSKFLAHKLRHFNFFFKNRALGYQNFFFFFQRRNNTWRMLLSNTYTRLTLLTVLKRMSFFQRSVVSKILAKYFDFMAKKSIQQNLIFDIPYL